MTLHHQYYKLREDCWKALEELVHKGCDYLGEFPIKVGEYTLAPNGLRTSTTCFADTCEITISGIVADPNYSIHPPKQSPKDISVVTNTIKVKKWKSQGEPEIIEVTPYLLDLQSLATYLSGGFNAYGPPPETTTSTEDKLDLTALSLIRLKVDKNTLSANDLAKLDSVLDGFDNDKFILMVLKDKGLHSYEEFINELNNPNSTYSVTVNGFIKGVLYGVIGFLKDRLKTTHTHD